MGVNRILTKDSINFIGKKIQLSGWVHTIREHGKILFIDLRDSGGVLQIVFSPDTKEVYELAKTLRPESVVSIEGEVKERPTSMVNPKIPTGKIEFQPSKLEILSMAETPPFPIDTDGYDISEDKRLKYRYLDLRRPRLQGNIRNRQKVIQYMRNFLIKEGFIEVETPLLTKATPEGARDFLVPARLQPGKFYALPQSPQQYKQLLMVAGFEKYFQIARCLRDEDPRGDRQAEFTQLDLEMAFVKEEDILSLIERLYVGIVKELFPEKKIQKIPFPRLKYKDVMEKYNSDKPDIRKNKEDNDELAFCFVVDFPMFEWKEEEKRWDAVHHPFTRPQVEDISVIKKEPKALLAHQYDFVLNGFEVGGGSLRSYKPEILEAVFEVMGHKKEQIQEKFGHLLTAFNYGVPPHGGIAPGIDRFLAILFHEPNIREVIAFPKTGDNKDLMMNAPSSVEKDQLKELHIKSLDK
ncbi:MAG: Aspartyl-tRNA synthetase [Parcubacteria group bacterium GW2011_GWC1_38_6]|nr:MAG: Aspartyl-tRNA synthetase [Parcubacteria group bacterium GW2011_GWC1_38_6]